MISWRGPEIITAPSEELNIDDVRAYCRLRPTEGSSEPRIVSSLDERLLNLLRLGVVLEAESIYNRAIFSQRRRVTAELPDTYMVERIRLEPFENLTVSTGDNLSSLSTISDYEEDGVVVIFDPIVNTKRIRFEYDAGWEISTLPADLKNALLDMIACQFERRNESEDQSGRIFKSKYNPKALKYRVDTDPVPLSPLA